MKVTVQVVMESEDGQTEQVQVAALNRGALRAEELGLSLAEAKALLHSIQETTSIIF